MLAARIPRSRIRAPLLQTIERLAAGVSDGADAPGWGALFIVIGVTVTASHYKVADPVAFEHPDGGAARTVRGGDSNSVNGRSDRYGIPRRKLRPQLELLRRVPGALEKQRIQRHRCIETEFRKSPARSVSYFP